MADGTHIEWTDATWNPITGCSIVSPGCTNCYAMRLAGTRLKHIPSRQGLTVDSKAGPVWNGQVRLNEQWLDQPLRWNRPRRIFVCAHGDLFAEGVPDEWIDRVFAVMALAPQHTFQVLTKRAARMRKYINGIQSKIPFLGRMPLERIHLEAAGHMEGDGGFMDVLKQHGNIYSLYLDAPWPLPNVWIGVSAERQQEADERVPELMATPAAIRFVSAEPLLGSIDFRRLRVVDTSASATYPMADALRGSFYLDPDHEAPFTRKLIEEERTRSRDPNGIGLDWIIVGGESGKGARPMHPDWVRSIRDQCANAGTAFFFKQWGNWSAVSQMSEEQIDACYPPFKERHPEATRHSLVDTHVLHTDGSRHNTVDRGAFLQGTGAMTMFEVGKKRAGRLLDGIEHNAMPEVRP